MAEDLGTRELGMVRSQGLDELLNTLRLLQDPSANSKLGIPALDRLFATNTPRFDHTNLSPVPAPPVIEISSPVPKSGKTELLYWIIAQLVLGDLPDDDAQHHNWAIDSTKEGTRETSGQEGDVPIENPNDQITNFETDSEVERNTAPLDDPPEHQSNSQPQPQSTRQHPTCPTALALLSTTPISIPRLAQVCIQTLLTAQPSLSLPCAQEKVHSCLHQVHIFQPPSLPSLISTLSSLPSYFLSPSNPSFDRRLVIMIDSASSFFWQDKVAGGGGGGAGGQGQGNVGKYPALAAVVKRISGQLQASVLFTTEHISPSIAPPTTTTTTTTSTSTSSSTEAKLGLRPQLPPPFPTLPTHRLMITRPSIPIFNKDVDAQTSVEQSQRREDKVRAAGFKVHVNQWGNEGRVDESRIRGFRLKINGEGVEMVDC